jgi:hypothetical protein
MIDWNKSAKLNNMSINELKLYFNKYSGSGKKIIAICDVPECNKERILEYKSYRSICNACATIKRFKDDPDIGKRQGKTLRQRYINNPELSQQLSDKALDRWNKPEAKEEMSQIKIDYWNGNEVAKEKARQIAIEQWSDQKVRDIQSETLKGSDKQKEQHNKQRGGNDIVKHHYIYDHSDLSKYTMEVTRSKHTYIHWLMWKSDIKVPHINKGGD